MNRFKSLVLWLGVSLVTGGCGSTSQPESLDVYFRPFMATSIVRLTEPMMLTSAGQKAHITDPVEIAKVMAALPRGCDPSLQDVQSMDLRALIYINRGSSRTTWKASNFDYYDSSTGQICKITPAIKKDVENVLSLT